MQLLRSLIVMCALCTLSLAYRLGGKFVPVHEIGTNTLSPLIQLPPEDPAIHSFPTVPTVPLVPVCNKEGYLRDPFNCGKFYYCQYVDAVPAGFYCQSGLIFNTVTNTCDHSTHVDC
ncbi:uncharacterized protein LOC143145797 [Ptiloglossa arizonensis]|uniref:uncharacterized protein LOC143145797 n=1 Tax=Ptiloglossa arizonensis TaxID=3350558 RepID=UPI003F9EE84A